MEKLEKLFSLEGKVALVTGGYRGLGLEFARGLADCRAKVAINGRSAEGVLKSVESMKAAGHEVMPAIFDITDEEAVLKGISGIETEWGQVDILVNNAGIHRRNKLEDMTPEEFRTVLDTNLTAAFIVAKSVVRGMMERQSGKIINISSMMYNLSRPTTANYCAAKAGLSMLTRSMAGEWAKHNIQINAIAPGYFETDLTRKLKEDPEFNSWICGRTPSARWGNPEELHGLVVFLASHSSSYINGETVIIDGGLSGVI